MEIGGDGIPVKPEHTHDIGLHLAVAPLTEQYDIAGARPLPETLVANQPDYAVRVDDADRKHVLSLIRKTVEHNPDDPDLAVFGKNPRDVTLRQSLLMTLKLMWEHAEEGDMTEEKNLNLRTYLQEDRPVLACNVFNGSFAEVFRIVTEQYGQNHDLAGKYTILPASPRMALDAPRDAQGAFPHQYLMLVSQGEEAIRVTPIDPYWTNKNKRDIRMNEVDMLDFSEYRGTDALYGYICETARVRPDRCIDEVGALLRMDRQQLDNRGRVILAALGYLSLREVPEVLEKYTLHRYVSTIERLDEELRMYQNNIAMITQSLLQAGEDDEVAVYDQRTAEFSQNIRDLQARAPFQSQIDQLPRETQELGELTERELRRGFEMLEQTSPEDLMVSDVTSVAAAFDLMVYYRLSIPEDLWGRADRIINAYNSRTASAVLTDSDAYLIRGRHYRTSLLYNQETASRGIPANDTETRDKYAALRASTLAACIRVDSSRINNLYDNIDACLRHRSADDLPLRILDRLVGDLSQSDDAASGRMGAIRQRLEAYRSQYRTKLETS